MTAHVYRCYDADGAVLYIGSTANLVKRLAAHRSKAWWAHRVVKVRAQVYPSMRDALDAERAAIHAEQPRCNVMGRASDRSAWTRQDYLDYVLARSLGGSAYTAYAKAHLGRLYAEYLGRFGEPMPEFMHQAAS